MAEAGAGSFHIAPVLGLFITVRSAPPHHSSRDQGSVPRDFLIVTPDRLAPRGCQCEGSVSTS